MKPSEQTLREVQNILLENVSGLPENDYRLATIVLPEEIKAKIMRFIAGYRETIHDLVADINRAAVNESLKVSPETRKILQEWDTMLRERLEPELEAVLKTLGGNTRQKILNVYRNFNFSTYWFHEGFGRHDDRFIKEQLQAISRELEMPVGDLKVLDVGTGNGRIMRVAADAVREMDPDNAEHFVKNNIRGFDLVSKVVQDARAGRHIRESNIPPEAVFEGDFLNLPEEHQREQYHLATVMMHTAWHCTTEEDWVKFLRSMEMALAPGGRMVFDTVYIYEPEDERDIDLDKLSFYTLLWRKYCDDMQPMVDQVLSDYGIPTEDLPRLNGLPRHFVQDMTAGVKGQSFVREVPKPEWITKLCDANGIRLKSSFHRDSHNSIVNDTKLTDMGMDWIHGNNLRDWLRREIEKRIYGPVTPEGKEERVKEIYRYIALNIVKNYVNRYFAFEKTR